MSEFSESYHLRGSQADGAALLERAGLGGWVFPDEDGCCALVPDLDPRFEPVPELAAANAGADALLLYYMNAEDHGWAVAAWRGADALGGYQAEWDDDVTVTRDDLDLAAVRSSVGDGSSVDWPAIEAVLARPPSFDDLVVPDGNPGHRFAHHLGLSHFQWMSGAYLAHGDDDTPGVVRVS